MLMLVILGVVLAACGDSGTGGAGVAPATSNPVPATSNPAPAATQQTSGSTPVTNDAQNTAGQDEHITVQHILIGFKDAVGFQGKAPGKAASRTQEEAKALAYDVLAKAKAGEDYDKLVTENTDDQAPGIYSMSNNGVTPLSQEEYPRNQMVPAFGNVGFALKIGEIGISDYDATSSPFGYHIIKRIAQPPAPTPPPTRAGQDAHIQVQHILIGFKDAVGFQGNAPGKAASRTQDQAKTLAYELLDKAKAGTDFDQLVKDNTDDQAPGIYGIANDGVQPVASEAPRNGMVPAFGDVGFALKVGEIGIADYSPQASPYGYHIIKRIR
jgi:parvulin-like peptidyl-prolyl isomerase